MKDQEARDLAIEAIDMVAAAADNYRLLKGDVDIVTVDCDDLRVLVNRQLEVISEMGAALNQLEARINSTRLGYVRVCPVCKHPAPMQRADVRFGAAVIPIPALQCLVCGTIFKEFKEPEKTYLVPYNDNSNNTGKPA